MSLTPEQLATIDAAVRSNQAVLAIESYRDATGASLPIAIEFVEARTRELQSPPVSVERTVAASTRNKRWRRNCTSLFILRPGPFAKDFLSLQRCVPESWWEEIVEEVRTDPNCNDEDLDALNDSPSARQNGDVELSQSHANLLLEACIARCARANFAVESTSVFFADLESSPPDWQRLGPEASLAWDTFLGIADFSGRGNDQLPWWLGCVRGAGAIFVGLLTPEKVKLIESNAAELKAMFGDHAGPKEFHEDVAAMFDLIGDAAAQGAWLLGREPQG
jgi:hypothetical protein